jgi:hypothetical protein
MTQEELFLLKFNTPIQSLLDNSVWFYHEIIRNGLCVKIYKELTDNNLPAYWGREASPWTQKDSLTISTTMMLQDFVLFHKVTQKDIKLVKCDKKLTEMYSMTGPNFHMMGDTILI